MKLLPEYAVLREVFEGSSEAVMLKVALFRERLFSDGLVRDLHGGAWSRSMDEFALLQTPPVRKILQEVLKHLSRARRLTDADSWLPQRPESVEEWRREALASHNADALDGIVVGAAAEFPMVDFAQLLNDPDLLRPVASVSVRHTIDDYLRHLAPVLKHAGRICFIDPYLNPAARPYRDFLQILLAMSRRGGRFPVELHIKCKQGEREPIRKRPDDWLPLFQDWQSQLDAAGVSVDVFVWPDFHNRYVISDIIGLHIGRGFHTTSDPNAYDSWTRLGTADRVKVDREFDPNSARHRPWCQLTIGRLRG